MSAVLGKRQLARLGKLGPSVMGERLGGFIYGTIVVLSVLVAGSRAYPDDAGRIAVLVVVTSTVFWLAHVYAHGVADRIAREHHASIADLRRIRARVRFLSVEPLIGPIPRLPLAGIHWVIVGGESGPGARPMNPEWVRQIRNRCRQYRVPFFFKQWGGVNKKAAGRELDGQHWDQMPNHSGN